MSYILDALKKSEDQQNPDHAVTEVLRETRSARQQRWLIVVAAALALNALVLLILFAPWRGDADPSAPTVTAPGQSTPTTQPRPVAWPAEPSVSAAAEAEDDAQSPIIEPNNAPDLSSVQDPGPVSAAVLHTPVPDSDEALATWPDAPAGALVIGPKSSSPTIRLDQLPAADRSAFPPMVFSTHIFAEDQDLRALVINGERHQEGDLIGEAALEAITETGAVIAFRGHRIEIPIVESW